MASGGRRRADGWWRELLGRETGSFSPESFSARLRQRRYSSLELSPNKEFSSVKSLSTGINAMELDSSERRYLLAGSGDGAVAVYDTVYPTPPEDPPPPLEQASAPDPVADGSGRPASSTGPADQEPSSSGRAGQQQQNRGARSRHGGAYGRQMHKPVLRRKRGKGHTRSVSSVAWYPVDTGLFFSGGYDNVFCMWDANTGVPEIRLTLPVKIYGLSAPTNARSHCLIAAGLGDPNVKLFDVVAGAFVHTLTGHKDAVWTVRWAPEEFILYTGGCDGTLRVWDIRRTGQLGAFDINNAPNPGGLGQPDCLAHMGPVSGIEPTADGRFVLSNGVDGRLRLWDAQSRRNLLVHFPRSTGTPRTGARMASTEDGRVAFSPAGKTARFRGEVQVFDMQSGLLRTTLRAHFGTVTAAVYHSDYQELYTSSHDGNLLAWTPKRTVVDDSDELEEGGRGDSGGGGAAGEAGAVPRRKRSRANVDAWSDDEGVEDMRGPRLVYR